MRATLTALGHLTAALLRRMLREPLVVRSLVFPVALTAGTLVLTLLVVAYVRARPVVALPAHLHVVELTQPLEERGFRPRVFDEPLAAVDEGRAWAGTDGTVLALSDAGSKALVLESTVRQHLDAPWRPDPVIKLPEAPQAHRFGKAVAGLLAAVFGLYGVVFGAGMIARDRAGGTLEVEMTLGVPRWVHGAARWMAGSVILVGFLWAGLALFEALLGTGQPVTLAIHGAAGAIGATALGVLAMSRAGPRNNFSGPLAAALSAATGLFGLGYALPDIGRMLPMASVVTGGPPLVPMAVALLLGAVSMALFARAEVV